MRVDADGRGAGGASMFDCVATGTLLWEDGDLYRGMKLEPGVGTKDGVVVCNTS